MKKAKAVKDPESVEYLKDLIYRQLDFIRSYKARQDDVYRGLGQIQKMLKLGAYEAASTLIEDLPSRELKHAKERVDNHSMALGLAIECIKDFIDEDHERGCQCIRCGKDGDNVKGNNALSQIEILCPEAFEKTSVGTAS